MMTEHYKDVFPEPLTRPIKKRVRLPKTDGPADGVNCCHPTFGDPWVFFDKHQYGDINELRKLIRWLSHIVEYLEQERSRK